MQKILTIDDFIGRLWFCYLLYFGERESVSLKCGWRSRRPIPMVPLYPLLNEQHNSLGKH